ncbi:MAG: EAL domain-containing protein [Rhodoferax sp.]|nr:EAL domain-containing protein [Rhodoferax sp.]
MNTEASGLNREAHDTNEVVFRTGEYGDAAYVIESGCVEVLVGPADMPKRVAVLTEGAMFGEVALLDRQARTATVRTLMPTRLVRIDRTHVEELLARADPVIQYLLRLMLERFRNSSGVPAGAELTDSSASGKAELHSLAVHTLSLAHDLAQAIAANQLVLYYQPIILLNGNVPVGFEALVRWQHPKLGMISPDEFIPLAEKTGLVHRIGEWVLHRAAADWPSLRACSVGSAEHQPFMSVNLSAPELCTPGIVQSIQACLAQHAMPAQELRIELTETAIVSSLEAVSTAIHALRDLGVGIALDDFGTGYAGLGYLQTLPFSCLKIDKTFVQQMHGSGRSFQIVKSALELSKQLGLSTVAEGIEDEATANALRDMGSTYAQGYYFARPMPASAIAAWAQAQGGRVVG